MVELHKQKMEPAIFAKLRKSAVKCRTWFCDERHEMSENLSPVSLMEFMVDAVGTLRLPEKGNDVVVRVVYYWSSCTVREFTLGWRGNSFKMDFGDGPGKRSSIDQASINMRKR